MRKETPETQALVRAAVEAGTITLLKLIQAGNGKSVLVHVAGEVWEISAKKLNGKNISKCLLLL